MENTNLQICPQCEQMDELNENGLCQVCQGINDKYDIEEMGELLTKFEAMKSMPMFEIRYDDYGIEHDNDSEYVYTYISADKDGVWCEDVYLSWDKDFSLDEHLQTLFEMYIEKLQSGAE